MKTLGNTFFILGVICLAGVLYGYYTRDIALEILMATMTIICFVFDVGITVIKVLCVLHGITTLTPQHRENKNSP